MAAYSQRARYTAKPPGKVMEKTGGFALAPQTMCSPRRGCRTGVRQKSAFVPGPTRQSYTRAWRLSDQISKRTVLRPSTAAASGGMLDKAPKPLTYSWRLRVWIAVVVSLSAFSGGTVGSRPPRNWPDQSLPAFAPVPNARRLPVYSKDALFPD